MDDILDSLGNPLEEGKYYQLDFQPRVQYIGPSDTGSVFNFKPPGRRIVVRTLERLQAIPPVRLGDEAGDETDGEYESPLDGHKPKGAFSLFYDESDDESDDEDLDLGEVGGRRRRKKTRRHRKKTRKHRRKTRKHRKKSRKHRKR